MNLKYLYGKKSILGNLIDGKAGLRITDLSHYARMENEKMRDDEMKRDFFFDKNTVQLTINGHLIANSSYVKDPKITIPVKHCYCLCLSNKENSDLLYREFKADVCIAFDIEKLIETFKFVFSGKFEGMEIISKNVNYFDPYKTFDKQIELLNSKELAFYKNKKFDYEDEYRIAFFYPEKKSGFKDIDGNIIPFFNEKSSTFIDINHKEHPIFTDCIVDVFYKDSEVG